MYLKVYPKLNIFLKIIGKEEVGAGGYHLIQSRFALGLGSLYDEMSLRHAQHFRLQGNFGCDTESNLIYKAKCTLQEWLNTNHRYSHAKQLEFCHIEVQKNIPQGAGLGGGSANAGAYLCAVNTMFNLGLQTKELLNIAAHIGADVSFFVSQEDEANVSGRGEIIESIHHLPSKQKPKYEIYTPPIFCDTRKVYARYAHFIQTKKQIYSTNTTSWLALSTQDFFAQHIAREEANDLFYSACDIYPNLLLVANELGNQWYFSGSGSSFFRILN